MPDNAMPVRIVVTGREGQVARALSERCAGNRRFELVHAARPDFDFEKPAMLADEIVALEPDVVVNAAAYTAVEQAESEPDRAMTINADAAGEIARGARLAGAPVIQISTDYVFDGTLDRPYREDDPVSPLGVYGRTKLAGEKAVAAANERHLILRTAWIYSPFGRNFVRTMLNLAETRDRIEVIDDQFGNPTSALDLADGILAAIGKVTASEASPRFGVFHLAGSGSASWYELAREVFSAAAPVIGRSPQIRAIGTKQYPSRVRRPANSRLDCDRFAAKFACTLPNWRESVQECVERLLGSEKAER